MRDDDDMNQCARCHQTYNPREGSEPDHTSVCDPCAHDVVEERDAEIARLRAALAAGPAALRIERDRGGYLRVASMDDIVDLVERAQKKAMGET
jgi:hypothetical protein